MVAALTDSTSVRSISPSRSRPCRSSAGRSVGIITTSRLPHTRSDASHSAIRASLIASYLRPRRRAPAPRPERFEPLLDSARNACLRCQPVVAHSSSSIRPSHTAPAAR